MSLPSVPPGFQYTTLSKPGGGWDPQSIPYNQSPAVVTGDTLMTPLLTAEGHAVTLTADGIGSVDTAGSTARQLLVGVDIYRVAADAFMGAATFAINDQAPSADPLSDPFVVRYNVAMTSTDLSTLFSDVELDALTFAVTAGSAPTGTSINSSGVWTGTPSAVSSGSFTLTASDPYNATDDLLIAWSVISQVAVPQVSDPANPISEGAAVATITGVFLQSAIGSRRFSAQIPIGDVISQSPVATTLVDPGSTVTLDISTGRGDGVLATTFLDDLTAVPASASFISGHAFAQDGTQYIARWPSSGIVFYDGPFAYRNDGALIVTNSGITAVLPQGVALTSRGEVSVAVATPEFIHNRWPLLRDGTVCVSAMASGSYLLTESGNVLTTELGQRLTL